MANGGRAITAIFRQRDVGYSDCHRRDAAKGGGYSGDICEAGIAVASARGRKAHIGIHEENDRPVPRRTQAAEGYEMSIAPVISAENTGLDEEHPWPGLESFTENDCEYFYGRDDETA